MDNLYRWVAKHKVAAMILFSAFMCAAYSGLFLFLNAPIWCVVFVNFVLILLNACFVVSCPNLLLQKPLKEREERCDPYPLLQEVETLLSYNPSGASWQVLLINKSVALEDMGAYAQALDILRTINIDQYAGTIPLNKIVYYHNLSGLYADVGDFSQADIWYAKMMQLYGDMKESKQKRQFAPNVAMAQAAACFRRGDCAQTLAILNATQVSSLHMGVNKALLCARAYWQLRDFQRAREALLFVIQNGNRLYAVVEAQRLLAQYRL